MDISEGVGTAGKVWEERVRVVLWIRYLRKENLRNRSFSYTDVSDATMIATIIQPSAPVTVTTEE